MITEKQPPPIDVPGKHYFEFLAKMGVTKHIGSLKATDELCRLCHISQGTYVLDAGCGVGATPAYLVKTYGCRVVGVDLLPKMIEQSQARAKAEGIQERTTFTTGDVRAMPFPDRLFDVVLVESLNVFFEDKQRAMREYMRVTRPGGYVGITEMTWLAPPPPQATDYYQKTVYADVLQAEGWAQLLRDAGLKEVVANAYKLDIPLEARNRIKRYGGCRGMLQMLVNVVIALCQDPNSWAFLQDVVNDIPKDLIASTGYGVYVGRKT